MAKGNIHEPDLSRFVIVLCRAEEAGNVGSACRAMKTMGIERLVLAGGAEYDRNRVATMAVHAFDIYEKAARFPDLASALAERGLVAGFSRRRGGDRKTFSLPVDEFAGQAISRRAEGDVALVFGNEKSGLSTEELALCSLAVHIPSSPAFPSLNLAQSVQVACWELRKQAGGPRSAGYEAASREAIVDTVTRASRRLAELGFFKLNQGDQLKEFLRDLAERAALSPSELGYFEAFIQKMAGLAGKRSRSDAGASSVPSSAEDDVLGPDRIPAAR